jgi:hypothetical protein
VQIFLVFTHDLGQNYPFGLAMPHGKANFEIRLMRVILIAWLLGVCPLLAQRVTMNALPDGRSLYSHYRVLGENAGGVYLMNYRDADMRKNFTIIRSSHSLEYLNEKPIELGRKSRLIKLFTYDSGICMVYLEKIRQQTWLQYRLIAPGLDKESAGTLGVLDNPESMDAVTAEYSFNRQWIGIWTEGVSEQGLQKLGVTLFHLPTGRKLQHNCLVPFSAKQVTIEEAALGNEGQHACTVSYDEEAGRRSPIRYFAAFGTVAGFKPLLPINTTSYHVSGMELVRDEFTGCFVLGGFWDENKEERSGGCLMLSLADSIEEGNSAPVTKTVFSEDLVSELIGATAQEKGRLPENLFVRKVVPRDDGGTLLIAEKFYITQHLETFYINGIPQTSSKNIYHYDDVLIVSLNPNAEMEWFKVLHKRQSGFAGAGFYNGIAVYVCDNSVNLLYNDNVTQNNRVMHVSIDKKGAILQKVLFNSDEVYTGFVPQEGKQIGYNRFLVPLTMDKKPLLLKLTQD